MSPDELREHVDTIVILMLENRSFDNVLGHLASPEYGNRSDVRGIVNPADARWRNPNLDGEGIPPFWMRDRLLESDLPHDSVSVATQLAFSPVRGECSMNGFVRAFEEEFHTSVDQPAVMGLLRPSDVPATGALAARYTVCDNWFACLPTSTAPNRLMSMCGDSNLTETHGLLPNQRTVYDWLLDRGVRWRVYSAGLPFLTLMPRLAPLLLTSHFRHTRGLEKDLARDGPDDWPQVLFIEPDYYDSPVHFQKPCDNHPPLPIAPGERFVRAMYNVLSGNKRRWAKTVFVLTYDEHGGFFDHVPPAPIAYRNPAAEVRFDSTGPRTPAIVAGPFAAPTVSHALLDNTSILQLLAERFGDPGEGYSPAVEERRGQGIESLSLLLDAAAGNTRVRPLPLTRRLYTRPAPLPSALRSAFQMAGSTLLSRHGSEALAKYPELAQLASA